MRVSSLRRLAILAALASVPAIVSATASLRPLDQAQEQSTTLVTVDFRVLGRDGSPVLDLKPEEITLKVGNRARDIVALELVKAGGDTPAAAAKAPPAPPPPFITNAPMVGGRSVMLVVDEEAIQPGHEEPVRDALGQLVAALTPADQVGLMTLKGGVVVHPTVRRDRVLQDIAELRGLPGTTDVICRTRMAHDALMNQFENAVPSVPTIVVLVSNGLTAPSTTTMSAMGRGGAAIGSASASSCEFTSGDLDALTTAAVSARAHVYGLEAFYGADVSGGFENFANLTGNARVRLSGDTLPAMKRIANETLAYYVAAFEVTDQERTGASQRVAVTVARQNVDVKAQAMVVFPKPAAKPGAKEAKPDKAKLRDLLVAAKMYRDVPLRATVHLSRTASPDGKLKVVCVFDSADPAAKIAEASVALFDTTGKARAQWTGQPADFKASPVVAALTAPGPGTYRLRLAVIDASGAAGTINEDVRVEEANPGTAQASALVLGTQAGGRFSPRLEFVDEQVAIAEVEVFGVAKATSVTATFEFAESETSPAAAKLPGTVEAPRDDVRIAYVSVPTAQMPAGDFVIRAVITVDGQPLESKPVHTLRKVVR